MYKDKEKQRETTKERQRRYREKQKGVTGETVPASYVQGVTGIFETLPERPRFLTLSDGQVLDRLNQPTGYAGGDTILRLRYSNEACYNFKPNKPKKEAQTITRLIVDHKEAS